MRISLISGRIDAYVDKDKDKVWELDDVIFNVCKLSFIITSNNVKHHIDFELSSQQRQLFDPSSGLWTVSFALSRFQRNIRPNARRPSGNFFALYLSSNLLLVQKVLLSDSTRAACKSLSHYIFKSGMREIMVLVLMLWCSSEGCALINHRAQLPIFVPVTQIFANAFIYPHVTYKVISKRQISCRFHFLGRTVAKHEKKKKKICTLKLIITDCQCLSAWFSDEMKTLTFLLLWTYERNSTMYFKSRLKKQT